MTICSIISSGLVSDFCLSQPVWPTSDVCIERNAYFASSLKQSLGYAFGLWSAALSVNLEISLWPYLLLGLGGVASPLICQTIIATGIPWSRFYLGSLVLSAFNVAFLVITFKPTTTEFLRDRENALIFANRLTKDSGASHMEAISTMNKFESETGSIDHEDKRNSGKPLYQYFVSFIMSFSC